MHLLAHLHGAVALLVLCSLLYADEAGIPIPVAPNELLLLLGGVLIQAGGLHAIIFFPLALVVMTAGMLSGYGWARLAGRGGLERLVRRVHAANAYRKVKERLASAGPLGVAVARLLPGVRPWATLVAGAAEIDLRMFLAGALPALLLWEVVWVTLGIVVGVPVTHFLGSFERLIVRGVVLLFLGLIAYAAVRRLRAINLLRESHVTLATPFFVILGGGAVACLTAGTLAILRGTLQVRHRGWVDALVVLAVLALSASVALIRRGPAHHRPGRPALHV